MVSPSLLAADFGNLEREMQWFNDSEADWLHLDVMDGVFVPNISFGFPVLRAVSRLCSKPLDAHMMVEHPEKYVSQVRDLGTKYMTVHYEACTHLHRVVSQIHEAGMLAGVTLCPATPVCMLQDIISDVDMVLLMSVNPGFGGQRFIPQTMEKVSALRELCEQSQVKPLIEVDGGVTLDNAPSLRQAGFDVLVAGSAVFGAANPAEACRILHRL